MKLTTRIGAAVCALVVGGLLAAGCGSSSSSNGTSGKALDLVPKTAIGYATADLNFNDGSWTKFEKLAGAFDANFNLDQQIGKMGGKNVDYQRDLKPWLGKSGGVAIDAIDIDAAMKSKKGDGGIQAFSWVEITNRAKLESYLKSQHYTKDGSASDFAAWKDAKGSSFVGVSNDLMISNSTLAGLKAVASYKGDSITDASGVKDITENVDKNALARVIINGPAIASSINKSKLGGSLADGKALGKLQGAALVVTAEDKGLHVHSFTKGMASKGDDSNDLFKSIPADTVVGLGGHNLGSALEQGLGVASKSPKLGGAITQIGALLGITPAQIGSAFSGQFTLGLSGSDAGLQSVLGSVVGAVVSKNLKSLNPAAIAKSSALTLAFSGGTNTAQTLGKITLGAGRLLHSPAAKVAKVGTFQTSSTTIAGLPVTVAASKDVSALSIGTDVFSKWGTAKLGDNATFTSAWAAAGAPDNATASFWLDYPRIAKLADLKGKAGTTAGGWVGWGTHSGDMTTFDVFMQATAG
ncbi:MAG: DUF3352 domain-containing protein [Gaiellales bacterium]